MGTQVVVSREKLIADLRRQVYLGDGVYAHHDGHQVWLITMSGEVLAGGGENHIALEAEVIVALEKYVESVKRQIAVINATPPADQ